MLALLLAPPDASTVIGAYALAAPTTPSSRAQEPRRNDHVRTAPGWSPDQVIRTVVPRTVAVPDPARDPSGSVSNAVSSPAGGCIGISA